MGHTSESRSQLSPCSSDGSMTSPVSRGDSKYLDEDLLSSDEELDVETNEPDQTEPLSPGQSSLSPGQTSAQSLSAGLVSRAPFVAGFTSGPAFSVGLPSTHSFSGIPGLSVPKPIINLTGSSGESEK